jgi:transcription antitermination factor NusG
MQQTALLEPDPFWACARVIREQLACISLLQRGYEIFAPRVASRTGPPALLFPAHVFILVVSMKWRSADAAPGVHKLIRFSDDGPSRVPAAEVDAIRAMLGPNGLVNLPEAPSPSARRKFAVGAAVKITGGPFAGHRGLFQGQAPKDRERILLGMLFGMLFGSAREVRVHHSLIVPA